MKILVVGLGLIGGSICMSLKRAGHEVYGRNRSHKAVEYAISHGIIDGEGEDVSLFDVVFVALPPAACESFISSAPFKSGAVVSDICGVKRRLCSAANKRSDILYVGCHPMAGKEVTGIEHAAADLFDRASMVITPTPATDAAALAKIVGLTKDMGFKYIVECSPELHDRKIAYTSQLAHVVSNSYVNDPEISACLGFTGGSFQDMTRIAGVDENAWASLYLENADNLLDKVDNLICNLSRFKEALASAKESNGTEGLVECLSKGAGLYRAGKAEEFFGEGIKVTRLK